MSKVRNTIFDRLSKACDWDFDFESNKVNHRYVKLPMCRIKGDWKKVSKIKVKPSTSLGSAKKQHSVYGVKWEERFTEGYLSTDQKKAIDCLGLENANGYVHLQKPGQSHILHIDTVYGGGHWDYLGDQKRNKVRRVFLMLQDWQPGQIIQFGNVMYSKWKAGDVAYVRWQDIPHGTANFGHHDRSLILVTGVTTPKFEKLLKMKNPKTLYVR